MASHPDVPEQVPVVERTTVGVAAELPERMRAALEDLRLLPSPASLAPLVRWSADGPLVLVHQVPAGAVPLSALRSGGPLRAGHVVAVARAAASALSALHAAGLAHGDVGVETLLVSPDGSVVLGATGAAWQEVQDMLAGRSSAAADVAAVADVIRTLLGQGRAPGPLVLAALRAGDSDPALRPTADELLDLLARCGAPEPLLAPLWRVDRHARGDERPDGSEGPPGDAPAVLQTVADVPVLPARLPAPGAGRASKAGPGGTAERPGGAAAASSGVPRRPGTSQPTARRAGRRRSASGRRDGSTVRSADDGAGPDRRTPGHRRAATGRRARRAARPRAVSVLLGLLLCVVAAMALRAAPVLVAGAEAPASGAAAASTGGAAAGPTSASTPLPTSAATGAVGPLSAAEAAPSASSAAVDWSAVLAALDSGRRRALGSASPDELARYVDPQGGAWADDLALLERLASSGARIEGGGLELGEVRVERVGGDAVRLVVRDRRLPYDVVDGGTTSHMAERPWRWWTVTLSASPSLDGPSWRIADVRGADDRAAP